jgi:hypothetical protein
MRLGQLLVKWLEKKPAFLTVEESVWAFAAVLEIPITEEQVQAVVSEYLRGRN